MPTKYIIHNYLNLEEQSNFKFKKKLLQNISNSGTKFGGFSLKKYLTQKINSFVASDKGRLVFTIDQSKNIQEIVENSLDKAMNILENDNVVHVYLIPTTNKFLKEYMDGIQGFCASRNAIHLYIHPDCNLKTGLVETLVHEYNHTVFYVHHTWKTVEEGLIAEGLAEHFRSEIVGGKRAKLTEVFDEKESTLWLEKIIPTLNSEAGQDYYNVFVNFDEEPYPLWTGYTIGYYLIERFRKQNKLNWQELMQVKPNEVLDSIKAVTN